MVDKRQRRRDGKDGWKKDECGFSRTGWAWTKKVYIGEGKQDYYACTCEPCKPPKEK